MVIAELVAGVVVAAGTIAAGIKALVASSYNRGRKEEREEAYKAKLAADLEELRRRLSNE